MDCIGSCADSCIDGTIFEKLINVIGILGGIALVIYILYLIFRSPFKYPYRTIDFDVSGKRSPDIMNLIDRYLIEHGFSEFTNHLERVNRWKDECQKRIKKSLFKGLRTEQYQSAIDDLHMFRFRLVRNQTRYTQKYYVKTPYVVAVVHLTYPIDFGTLKQRYKELAEIGFSCTLAEYHSKEN